MSKINIVKMMSSEDINALKQEVFEWAINAALISGLCTKNNEAAVLYTEKILDVFKFSPSKQHCFKIQLDGVGVIGRIWLMERISHDEGNPELRISYIKLDEMYQRKGLSRKALRLISEYADRNNFSILSLNVFGHLPHAKKLYESLGFQTVREYKKEEKLITTEMVKKVLPNYNDPRNSDQSTRQIKRVYSPE